MLVNIVGIGPETISLDELFTDHANDGSLSLTGLRG